MQYVGLILFVFAFVFFFIAVLRVGQPDWNKLVALGLTCFVASFIFGDIGALHLFR